MRSCDLFDGQAEEFDLPACGGLPQTPRDATRAVANVNAGSAPAHPHPLQLEPTAVDRCRQLLRDNGGMCAFVNTALLRSRLGRTADQPRQASRLSPAPPRSGASQTAPTSFRAASSRNALTTSSTASRSGFGGPSPPQPTTTNSAQTARGPTLASQCRPRQLMPANTVLASAKPLVCGSYSDSL